MTDKEIYDALTQREDKICERFEHNIKALTEFIATENQGMKKSIDDLTKKVEQQNSSVRKLNEWKAGIEGAEKQKNRGFENTFKVFGFVVAFVAMLTTIYFSYQKTKKDYESIKTDVVNMIDQYSYDIVTRSGYFEKDSI